MDLSDNLLLASDEVLPSDEEISQMPINLKKRSNITFTFEVENTWRKGSLNMWSICLNDYNDREELFARINNILYEELCKDFTFVFYDRQIIVEFDEIDISEYLDIGSARFKIAVYTKHSKPIGNLVVKTQICTGLGSFNNGHVYIQLSL